MVFRRRTIFAGLLALALIAIVAPALSREQHPASQTATARIEQSAAPIRVRLATTRQAPHLPREELERPQQMRAERRAAAPALPKGRGDAAAAPPEAESRPATAPQAADNPGVFTLFRSQRLGESGTHGSQGNTSVINSPSVAANRHVVFQTGNWHASLSLDGGRTFEFIDPTDIFTPTYGGFCCNQRVAYDPARDLFIWMLEYYTNGSRNAFKLAVATTDQLVAGTWSVWNFPADEGINWVAEGLEISTNYAWIAVNKYALNSGWQGARVFKISLDQLAGDELLTYAVFDSTNFAPRLVQGARHTMYFAAHNSTSQVRVFSWPETSSTVTTNDVNVPAWTDDVRVCPSPDGNNWCAQTDGRIQTGWVSNGTITFMWNAAQGGAFPYPYIEAVRMNETDKTVLSGITGRPLIYSTITAFQYPAAAPNGRGDVGLAFFYSSPETPPSVAAAIYDDYENPPPSWSYVGIAAGSLAAPSDTGWGSYHTVRSYNPTQLVWVGASYTLEGCTISGGNCAKPFYFVFGRKRDANSLYPHWSQPFGFHTFVPVLDE